MNNAVIEVKGNDFQLIYTVFLNDGSVYTFGFTNRGFYTDKTKDTIPEVEWNMEMNKEELDNIVSKDRQSIEEYLNKYIPYEEIGIYLLNQTSNEVFDKCKSADRIITNFSLATNGNMKCSDAVRNYCDELNKYSIKY